MLPPRLKTVSIAGLYTILIFAFSVACKSQDASTQPETESSASPAAPAVDASRAYDDVKRMVELGPRPSGSEALKKEQQFIQTELTSYGLKVTQDPFDAETPHGKIPMINIIGEVAGAKPDIVMITGHYDTKLLDDFVGANDGGSSAAALLEMARVLARSNPEYTLWFVFFDGEEAVVDWDANNGLDNTYGSRHLASKLKSDGTLTKVRAMILVDMIGDKRLDIKKDGNSTPWLVDLIWTTAAKVGNGKYFLGNETAIADDHLPFLSAGIPAVDIIDFDYGPDNSYWHTKQDTLDKISGESIKAVSDVVIRALPEIFRRLNTMKQGPPARVPS
jgi:Zn-dependent M28 family amino/carboxypeptidase